MQLQAAGNQKRQHKTITAVKNIFDIIRPFYSLYSIP